MDAQIELEAGEIIQRRWQVERKLASGGFGCVYIAVDKSSQVRCAVKVESLASKRGVLKMELAVLQKLSKVTEHACRLLGCGRVPSRYSFVVMTLLGRNLYELQRSLPQRRFNAPTTARMAIQCIEAIQAMHDVGYIHRDIKPANFAIGLPPTQRTVHLIDFGLARGYKTGDGSQVAQPRAKIGFRGTVRYASVTAHLGLELGRRDDLWSLLYVLVEFRLGSLPWRGVEDNEKETSKLKRALGIVQVTSGMERQYGEIGRQLLPLKYADKPDYEDFIRLLHEMQMEKDYSNDGPFEWEDG